LPVLLLELSNHCLALANRASLTCQPGEKNGSNLGEYKDCPQAETM
jgi:hypothetical protein